MGLTRTHFAAAGVSLPAAEFDTMDSMPVHVVAHFNARPDTVEAVREVVTGFIEPTRKEAGCITYVLVRNDADPLELTFIEEWASNEALDVHLQTPHLKQGAAKLASLLSKPGDIRRYTLVA
jgi:quinol monooxygenase YgiN